MPPQPDIVKEIRRENQRNAKKKIEMEENHARVDDTKQIDEPVASPVLKVTLSFCLLSFQFFIIQIKNLKFIPIHFNGTKRKS